MPARQTGLQPRWKKGKLQVNYGMVTDKRGCPVAVSVFDGNISDLCTVMTQVDKVKDSFGIDQMVLVGDRGMLSQKQIDGLNYQAEATPSLSNQNLCLCHCKLKEIRLQMDSNSNEAQQENRMQIFWILHQTN